MTPWKTWKGGFDRWERVTAAYLEKSLQSPSVLGPSATLLRVVMQAKMGGARIKSKGLRRLGITTREERELAQHRINQLESQVLDLQEELQDLRDRP